MWTPLDFGRYAGKTIPQVLFVDPDWFFWAFEKSLFQHSFALFREAGMAYRRATAIQVPRFETEANVVDYATNRFTGRFEGFEIVPANRPRHEGGSGTLRLDHIDMSIPRQLRNRDKGGMKLFVFQLKEFYFGRSDIRITKTLAEEFFEDIGNFVTP